MNELVEGLKQTLKNEDSRYVYADTAVNALVSAQIKALREDRKLSQQELADLVGTKQSGISRLEKAHYSTWKIETLRKLARAFGVRLRISFDEFGTLPPDIRGFTKERLCPRRFEDDPVFDESKAEKEERERIATWRTWLTFQNPHEQLSSGITPLQFYSSESGWRERLQAAEEAVAIFERYPELRQLAATTAGSLVTDPAVQNPSTTGPYKKKMKKLKLEKKTVSRYQRRRGLRIVDKAA